MMREVGKKIKVNKVVEFEEIITKEKITTITIVPDDKIIQLTISLYNSSDQLITESLVVLEEENYDLLFSEDPIFDEGKNTGSFRESDIWKMIDKVSD